MRLAFTSENVLSISIMVVEVLMLEIFLLSCFQVAHHIGFALFLLMENPIKPPE
jgi:hypothetical protein